MSDNPAMRLPTDAVWRVKCANPVCNHTYVQHIPLLGCYGALGKCDCLRFELPERIESRQCAEGQK